MSNLHQALESALLENPDDRGTCAACADHLSELGDPRGELIQTQLALEDARTPPANRKGLRAREKELLQEHERDWLGELAPFLLDGDVSEFPSDYYPEPARYAYSWHRGFLGRLEVSLLSQRFARTLAEAPAVRSLRELIIEKDAIDSVEMPPNLLPPRTRLPIRTSYQAFHDLFGAPWLGNLRVFQFGQQKDEDSTDFNTDCYSSGLELLLESMPRLEELYLLTRDYDIGPVFASRSLRNLRVLQADHLGKYPLERLVANPAMAKLTSLGFHPQGTEPSETRRGVAGCLPMHRFRPLLRSRRMRRVTHLRFRLSSAGDEGIRGLLEWGWLKRLKVLDLRHGCVTDEGARLLAGCPNLIVQRNIFL